MGVCRIDFADGFVLVGLLGCVWVWFGFGGWIGGCCIIRFCRFGFGFGVWV